jgi:hypothetical protein
VQNVPVVKILKTLQDAIADIFTKQFRVLATEFFKHWSESTTVHHLKEDPQSALKVETFEASQNHVVFFAHQHDTHLVEDDFTLCVVFGFDKLQSTDFFI